MIDIEREIERLEHAEPTWENIEKLAMLYIVSDKSDSQPKTVGVVPKVGSDEFARACKGVEIEPLMQILSEHFQAIKVLHPKEYQAVLDKIRSAS